MIAIRGEKARSIIRSAGARLAELFVLLPQVIVPGVSTAAIHEWIEHELERRQLISQSKGYCGFRHACCISINHVLVHGIPSEKIIVANGDVVKIDICASWKGFCADMTRCYCVGVVEPVAHKLIDAATEALNAGIAKAVVGGRLSDISSAIQRTAECHGFGVVRDFCSHGIGRRMHEDPEICNYGAPGRGPVLKDGMVFALEPMITQGDYRIEVAADGWTAYTVDRGLTAHVEDTVIVTEAGPEVVTRL